MVFIGILSLSNQHEFQCYQIKDGYQYGYVLSIQIPLIMLPFQIFIYSIMSKTVKKLALLFMLGTFIPQAFSTCGSYCQSQPSIYGDCKICYNQCEGTDKVSFKSCSITSGQGSQAQTLSETLCKLRCYPEEYRNLIVQAVEQPIEEPVGQIVDEKQVQPQIHVTLEELQKLNKETQDWTPQQNIFNIIGVLFLCSLAFIAIFTQIWRCIDKRQKLKQLQQNPKKEWVKQFQKVQNNQTSICSTDSGQNKVTEDY